MTHLDERMFRGPGNQTCKILNNKVDIPGWQLYLEVYVEITKFIDKA